MHVRFVARIVSPTSDYMPIVEPLFIRPKQADAFRVAHAWTEGSTYVACGKRVGKGWIVNAVAWLADPRNQYVRCRVCVACA